MVFRVLRLLCDELLVGNDFHGHAILRVLWQCHDNPVVAVNVGAN